MKDLRELKALLFATTAYYGQQIPAEIIAMYAEDLADLQLDQVKQSLVELRRDPKVTRFPLPALIRDRIVSRDGHPGVEEAWALLPKYEEDSVVWTPEIAEAYGAVAGLIRDGSEVEARMAFKEVYSRILGQARASGRRPQWTPSLGHDQRGRAAALRTAIDAGRITESRARELLPDYSMKPAAPVKQVTGAVESSSPEHAGEAIRDILARIKREEK